MYADRRTGFSLDTRSLTVALLLNGAALAGLICASPEIFVRPPDTPLTITAIPIKDPPPPEKLPKPQPHIRSAATIDTPKPIIERPIAVDPGPVLPTGPTIDLTGLGSGTGTGTAVIDPPAALPVLIGASVDPRFADALQPPYPSEEKRAEHEGRVVVRVLIGVDGRVKQVERVSATTDAFFRVTERQALSRWRFRPATRDGVPVEAWRQMAVRFELSADS